jgi:Rrf2 family protein
MRVSAKADYAVRALLELAASDTPLKGDAIADGQGIPLRFLENILGELRHAGLVRSQRGREGGYWLAKPAAEITIADVVRAAEGPLAAVRGEGPETVRYEGAAASLQEVWIALRTNLRAVVEAVTLADVVSGELPAEITELAREPDSWLTR